MDRTPPVAALAKLRAEKENDMTMPKLVGNTDASYGMGGIPAWKLDRLRRLGRVPEAVQVGRCWFYPESELIAIRDRLLKAGHLKPADIREFAHAG